MALLSSTSYFLVLLLTAIINCGVLGVYIISTNSSQQCFEEGTTIIIIVTEEESKAPTICLMNQAESVVEWGLTLRVSFAFKQSFSTSELLTFSQAIMTILLWKLRRKTKTTTAATLESPSLLRRLYS